MDLRNGNVDVWYAAPRNIAVNILGFDDRGHPLLELYGGDPAATVGLVLLTSPDQVVQLMSFAGGSARFATASADGQHGVWIGGSGSLWLYRSGSLFKVADIPFEAIGVGTPMPIDNAPGRTGNRPPPTVAGPCT
jgi:hypothetical protein